MAGETLQLPFEQRFWDELFYHDKQMAVINRDIETGGEVPIRNMVYKLRAGHTFSVNLEAGDATRYQLLITPNWGQNVQVEGCPKTAPDYLVITYFRQNYQTGNYPTVIMPAWSEIDLNALSNNDWTRQVLVWFFSGLWRILRDGQY